MDIGQTVKEIGSTAAIKLTQSPKTLALVETLGTLPPPTTDAGKAALQKMTDTLKAAIKNDPTLIDHLEKGLTPALSDRIVNLAKTHPEKLQELFLQLKGVNNAQDLTGLLDKAEKPPTPVAATTASPKPAATTTPASTTTPTTTTPAATTTATTPAVEPAAQALDILAKFGDRPDFKAFVQNLQTNHPDLAEAFGLGADSTAKPDPKRLAALLPALKKLDAAAKDDPDYFKKLSVQLDDAKANAPQTYAQIVDTAKNHPEKLGDAIEGAQNQFNMMSGIQEMGNKIGGYLGFNHLGDMLAGIFKWITGIPVIGPLIGGLLGHLMGNMGNLMGSAQDTDADGKPKLAGVSKDFTLAHELIHGSVEDASTGKIYHLDGKLDDKEQAELDAKKPDGVDYTYDDATKQTKIFSTKAGWAGLS
jgi:hypothetical protein